MAGAAQHERLDQVEAALPAGHGAELFAQTTAIMAEHIVDIDHAPDQVGHGAAEEAVGAERGEIDLHAGGAPVGLDVDRPGMQAGGEAELTIGRTGLARQRDQERRAETDDQRDDQRRGLPLREPARCGLAITGDPDDQASHARRRQALREIECMR
ncbi:hypothetical protein ACVIWU_008527 [Bradyrhizobium sp. USDA 4509]